MDKEQMQFELYKIFLRMNYEKNMGKGIYDYSGMIEKSLWESEGALDQFLEYEDGQNTE